MAKEKPAQPAKAPPKKVPRYAVKYYDASWKELHHLSFSEATSEEVAVAIDTWLETQTARAADTVRLANEVPNATFFVVEVQRG